MLQLDNNIDAFLKGRQVKSKTTIRKNQKQLGYSFLDKQFYKIRLVKKEKERQKKKF